jgi:uncharacterized membrane protein YecN with MAPEG domain
MNAGHWWVNLLGKVLLESREDDGRIKLKWKWGMSWIKLTRVVAFVSAVMNLWAMWPCY